MQDCVVGQPPCFEHLPEMGVVAALGTEYTWLADSARACCAALILGSGAGTGVLGRSERSRMQAIAGHSCCGTHAELVV